MLKTSFLVAFILIVLPQFLRSEDSYFTIEIDAKISEGSTIQVFVNDVPSSQPVAVGRRENYIYQIPAQRINSIRLDPSEFKNAKFTVYGVKIKFPSDKTPAIRFLENDFSSWEQRNISKEPKGSEYTYAATSSDPILVSPPGVVTYQLPESTISGILKQKAKESPARVVIFLGLLVLIGLFGQNRNHTIFIFLATVTCLTLIPLAYLFFNLISFSYPSATESVGWVNFYGYQKIKDILFFFLLCGFFTLLGILDHYFRNEDSKPVESLSDYKFSWTEKLAAWELPILYLGLFIFLFPNFQYNFDLINNASHNLSWDGMNVFTWKYFYEKGLVPLKDFWYPYGAQNMSFGPYLSDTLLLFAHKLWFNITFLLGLVRIFEKRRWPIILTIAVFLVANLIDTLFVPERYFSSFAVFVYFASLQANPQTSHKQYLYVGFCNSWLAYWEPHQLIYSLMGQGVLSFALFLPNYLPKAAKFEALKHWLTTVSLIVCPVAFTMMTYWKQGRLPGLFLFFYQTSGYSINAALPVEFDRILQSPYLYEGNVFYLYFLLFTVLTFDILKPPRGMKFTSAFILGSIFFLLPIMAKNLVRPHMSQQIIGIQLLVLAIYFFHLYIVSIRKPTAVLLSIFSGALLGYCVRDVRFTRISDYPQQIFNSLQSPFKVSKSYYSEPREFQNSKYFSDDKISLRGSSLRKFKNTVHARYPNKKVVVLGDSSVIYTALNQPVPYTFSFYDGAHIQLQNQFTDWIKKENIDVVIWDYTDREFDEVPFIVKNPIVFKYIIENYVFDSEYGNFQFLVRKNVEKPIDSTYWFKRIGTTLNLGYLGANASVKYLTECAVDESRTCKDFIEIPVDSGHPKDIELKGTFGGSEILLKLKSTHNSSLLTVSTDRIWFWNIVGAKNGRFFINSDYRIVRKQQTREFLY